MGEKFQFSTESQDAFEQVAVWLENRRRNRTLLVGIGGPGGSGKSTLARWLAGRIPGSALLPLDDFRLPRAERERRKIFGSHPDGNDLSRLRASLHAARLGQSFARPVFDSAAGAATSTELVPECRVLLCDGEIAAHRELRAEFDALIIVESHWRTQLDTRLTRDIGQRKFSVEKALTVFIQSNLRDYPNFADGARQAADVILYRNRTGGFRVIGQL